MDQHEEVSDDAAEATAQRPGGRNRCLLVELHRVGELAARMLRQALWAEGLHVAEWEVLESVLLRPQITVGDLASSLGLQLRAVRRPIVALSRLGLISRASHSVDGRVINLVATSLGAECADAVTLRLALAERCLATALGDHAFETLRASTFRTRPAFQRLLGVR